VHRRIGEKEETGIRGSEVVFKKSKFQNPNDNRFKLAGLSA